MLRRVPLATALLQVAAQDTTMTFDPEEISNTMNSGEMLDIEAIANFGSPYDDNRTAEEIAAAAERQFGAMNRLSNEPDPEDEAWADDESSKYIKPKQEVPEPEEEKPEPKKVPLVKVTPNQQVCSENGTCVKADSRGKIPAVTALFTYFDIDGSGGADSQELLSAFEDVDADVDDKLDAKELFSATIPVFRKLCKTPEFQQYYGSQLGEKKFVGAKSLFQSLTKISKERMAKRARESEQAGNLGRRLQKESTATQTEGENYPFFQLFDVNKDGSVSKQEWVDVFLEQGDRKELKYDDLLRYFQEQAKTICEDPRPATKVADSFQNKKVFGGLLGPVSDVYFALDRDQNGAIEPQDIQDFFKDMDSTKTGKISRVDFNEATDAILLETCMEAAKLCSRGDAAEKQTCEIQVQAELEGEDESTGRRLGSEMPCNNYGKVQWVKRSGKAIAIAAGEDDSIWVLGGRKSETGYSLFQYINNRWKKVDKIFGVRLAIDPNGNPWVINSDNMIFRRRNNSWERVRGRATDISIGAMGDIYVTSTNKVKGGHGIYKYNLETGKWGKQVGGAIRIAVATGGYPWIITDENEIKRWTGREWATLQQKAKEIAVGPEGSIMIVDVTQSVQKYDMNKWHVVSTTEQSGNVSQISVGNGGKPYITDSKKRIFWPDQPCPSKNKAQNPAKSCIDRPPPPNVSPSRPIAYTVHKGRRRGWHEALSFCQGEGGTLASVIDQREQSLIQSITGNVGYWIGLNDLRIEGEFVWSSGEDLMYDNFDRKELQLGGMRDCVAIKRAGFGQWGIQKCDQRNRFVCEKRWIPEEACTEVVAPTEPRNQGSSSMNEKVRNEVQYVKKAEPLKVEVKKIVTKAETGRCSKNRVVWKNLVGKAMEISVSKNGKIFVIGATKPIPGGYGIYSWQAKQKKWRAAPGGAVKIITDPNDQPIVINKSGSLFIFKKVDKRWSRLPGKMVEIAIGVNGQMFGLQKARKSRQGYSIKIFTEEKIWEFIPGKAIKIAVDPQGKPWIVTGDNRIKRWSRDRKKFLVVAGKASDISIGPEGTVFILGVKKGKLGQKIFRFDPDTGMWARVNGSATKISVGPNGKPHILTKNNKIFWPKEKCYKPKKAISRPKAVSVPDESQIKQEIEALTYRKRPDFDRKSDKPCLSMEKIKVKRRSGLARKISVGADGSIWAIGTNKMRGGYGIWRRINGVWEPVNSNSNIRDKAWRGAMRLAVGPTGNACFVRSNGVIGCFTEDGKVVRKNGRGKDIAIGADGTMYALGGKKARNGGYTIFKWQDNRWLQIRGRHGKRIAVDPQGNPLIVNDQGALWKYEEGVWTGIKGQAKEIAIGPEGSVVSLGRDKTTGGYRVFKWSDRNEQWSLVGSGATEVSVGPGGRIYYVNAFKRIFWPEEKCPTIVGDVRAEMNEIPDSDLPDSEMEIVKEEVPTDFVKEEEWSVPKMPADSEIVELPVSAPMKKVPVVPKRKTFSPKVKIFNMFDIFDKNRDNTIGVFEIYSMFSSADANKNFSLTPEELIKWIMRNKTAICYPYKRIIEIMKRD